jgi:hypothetical protein
MDQRRKAMRALISERRICVLVAAVVMALVAAVVISESPVSGATVAATSEMKTCEDNHRVCAIYPGGAWQQVNSGKASGGTYRVGSSTQRPAVFRVAVGPEINLVTATGPTRGTAKVTVYNLCDDNVAKVVYFNLRTESSRYGVVKTITGLRADRMYAVAVVSANGRPVVVDAYKGTPVTAVDHSTHHPDTPVQ